MFEVLYWTGSMSNRWEIFCIYGATAEAKARDVAGKLAELFAAVEIHIHHENAPMEIERIIPNPPSQVIFIDCEPDETDEAVVTAMNADLLGLYNRECGGRSCL